MKKLIIMATALLMLGACQQSQKEKQNGKLQKIEEIGGVTVPKISNFPVGNPNMGYAQYFSGKSWLAQLTSNKALNVPMYNVTFEPGSRTNWHSHSGGQILIVVGGKGYYQERGKPARLLEPGDVVEIGPNVEHWHGAAPDSWFSHIGITCNPQTNENTWMEPVSDEEYATAVK